VKSNFKAWIGIDPKVAAHFFSALYYDSFLSCLKPCRFLGYPCSWWGCTGPPENLIVIKRACGQSMNKVRLRTVWEYKKINPRKGFKP